MNRYHLLCPGAYGAADWLPVIFLACPGGIPFLFVFTETQDPNNIAISGISISNFFFLAQNID